MSWHLKLYQITRKCYPSLIKDEVPYVVAPQVVPDNIGMLPFVDRIVWFLFSHFFFLVILLCYTEVRFVLATLVYLENITNTSVLILLQFLNWQSIFTTYE